jgi:hypothetical protein
LSSVERLLHFLNALDRDVEIVIRKKTASCKTARIVVTERSAVRGVVPAELRSAWTFDFAQGRLTGAPVPTLTHPHTDTSAS